MAEWIQIKSIEMLVSRIEYFDDFSDKTNNITFSCDLLNIARGRCEIVFKKMLEDHEYENKIFISASKPIMNATKYLDENKYNNLITNLRSFIQIKANKIKITLFIDEPLAINNSGILRVENDLDLKLNRVLFKIPIL